MEGLLHLPPGFRFHPTEEEVIVDYLRKKVLDGRFNSIAIVEVDLNKREPWDLPNKAKNGEKELYVFYHKDRKYPTGSRTNRATKSGYWKATGKDKAIYDGKGNLIGMKKTLVFYKGRAPRGGKTNWVMHEFRLEGKFYKNLKGTEKDEWVVCRVINKTDGPMDQIITTNPIPSYPDQNHDLYDIQTLPPLIDAPYLDTTVTTLPYSFPFNNNNSSSSTDHTGDFKDFSPNNVLQPNRLTSFIPPSITQRTFYPQFTFNNPYTTHQAPSNYHPPYVFTSSISIEPTPISTDNFQYLHQDGSTSGFIDPNQTTQISKEEETQDLSFTDPVPGMHRSQSAEDISRILSFDGLFGDAPSSWKI